MGRMRRILLGRRLLLGVVVLGEGAEDLDLLPLRSGLDGLGVALEQVQRLAGLLCRMEKKVSIKDIIE